MGTSVCIGREGRTCASSCAERIFFQPNLTRFCNLEFGQIPGKGKATPAFNEFSRDFHQKKTLVQSHRSTQNEKRTFLVEQRRTYEPLQTFRSPWIILYNRRDAPSRYDRSSAFPSRLIRISIPDFRRKHLKYSEGAIKEKTLRPLLLTLISSSCSSSRCRVKKAISIDLYRLPSPGPSSH